MASQVGGDTRQRAPPAGGGAAGSEPNAAPNGGSGAGGSGGSAGSTTADGGAPKTKKPRDSAFKQQRLPAWQPILTAGTVLPTFFVIGVAFIPIGIGMLWFSDNVREFKRDYTDCDSKEVGGKTCAQVVDDRAGADLDANCTCVIDFKIEEDWEGEVFMYYGLTNFYQNHRRYVKSRSDTQLLGNVDEKALSNCEPFDFDTEKRPYVPCGAIANSMFSDDIALYRLDDNDQRSAVSLIRTGIAWESDKKYKFKNPEGDLKEALKDTARPRDWHKELWELDPENPDNNGLQNEDLIVWMRTAALPNFRKLYRKINQTGIYENKLPKGNYQFTINYRFRVKQFSGTKSVILSTTSLLGGKNPFLGIAYITVGSICLLMGVVFLFIHIKCGKQTNDMMNINSRSSYN